jgi:hypothetical protein
MPMAADAAQLCGITAIVGCAIESAPESCTILRKALAPDARSDYTAAVRERRLSAKQPNRNNFRIWNYWTRTVRGKSIESARSQQKWREARSMLILKTGSQCANSAHL